MAIKKAAFNRVNPHMMLAATRKLVDINLGNADPDDRDSLENQTLLGPEDFFSERINKDSGGIGQKILWKSTGAGRLVGANSGALTPQLESILIGSGLSSALEEINPLEIHDQHLRVTRMGEGGIPNTQSISDEAKAVQPSQFGYIDALRGPESEKLGVDTRLTLGTYKGDDGNIYSDFRDVRTGRIKRVSAKEAAKKVLAFPGELSKKGKTVRALIHGKLGYTNRNNVDYELPHPSGMFTTLTNMVPMPNTTQGNRLFTAGKMITQALPLYKAEEPLVQSSTDDGGVGYVEALGEKLGAIRANEGGEVVSTSKNSIKVRHDDGTVRTYELYDNFPLNRKTQLHNTRQVKAGDRVNKGQILASSNFTNENGVAAIGKNLRVAFVPYKGAFEDAYIMSESGAKKLSSEHMYTKELDLADGVNTNTSKFVSMFPSTYTKEQLKKMDDTGKIKVGSKVQKGDPVVLATGTVNPKAEGQWTSISGKIGKKFRDKSQVWDHEAEGIVTDVVETPKGVKVAIKSIMPLKPADKISASYGDKGVVARVVPDEEMPKDEQGRPFDVIQNPLTLPTRMNPAQIYEMLLAKVARKTGKPYKISQFKDEDMAEFVANELKKHSLKDTESVFDPAANRALKDILTGEKYFMKLHHTAESKEGARATANYTSDDTPASGGKEGSKTIANLGLNALLSHGATGFIRDSKLYRGQRNDDFWRAYKLGLKPPAQKESTIYRKYLAHLQGAGVKVDQQPNQINIMALTDDDISKISSGAIKTSDTVDSKDLSPKPGGLFDRALTGSHGGTKYSHIELKEPMPNPVMEEPIRRLLGLTKKDLRAVIAGEKDINGLTGGSGLKEALRRLPVDKLINAAKDDIKTSKGAKRDNSIKRLRYLTMMKDTGIKPESLVLTKFPVIPPMFRPISKMDNDVQLAADANYLYQDLMLHNEVLEDVRKEFGNEGAGEEKVNLYNALQAVAGVADPVPQKLKDQKVKGLLKHVFGKGSPKHGQYQRRVIGMHTDLAGRSAITPNPDLDMDEVGLPEDQAWKMYEPFIIRKMVKLGVPATDAAKMVENRDPRAKDALVSALEERPIIITRAPALGKYNMVASKPKLIKGNSLQTSPIIMASLTGDYDGDTMSYHVPVSDEAVQDAFDKMLPSKNLLYAQDFDAHYVPSQEYIYGLYQAAKAKKGGKQHTFRSKEEAIKAYRRGEIGINDEVVIYK